ncbi:YkoF family thiamine/hydroxymethylpyrimidine-binding protein [Aquimarina gracilis]|uniref:YkoF family thiamine/hydroxymethylpyrimidine-binding protein n=1 Tax=Aquimarina gracilis TaxID=874422 RepID=A0ABU6A0D5_9FLAO|nr:YkoF family thiamine/hydroxymethylpyrimidine-binding protein [Aquimarina gracilis]MEB3347582.1 YkoF family thiamine/hydroxymethylpyrimidine-binding protein [Aquimarina gracilis]
MQVSIELTLTPLQNDYESHIIRFIKRLRASQFKVLENPLSTQIYGEYDEVMSFVTKEIKTAFGDMDHVLVYMKMVKSNRSDYEPHF